MSLISTLVLKCSANVFLGLVGVCVGRGASFYLSQIFHMIDLKFNLMGMFV